jgi:hypothetical protein
MLPELALISIRLRPRRFRSRRGSNVGKDDSHGVPTHFLGTYQSLETRVRSEFP